MSKYSDYINTLKENDLKYFYGDDVKKKSNKYFTFTRIKDEDNIIIVTNNITTIKNSPALVVDNNKVVFLKEWQIRPIKNWDEQENAWAVKLNRNFFKTYTFQNNFDFHFEKEDTFDNLVKLAEEQQEENMKWSQGHFRWSDED